jgi:outer membrane protein assembly factor BamA
MTGGQDALGIHAFSLEGYYGLSSRRPNLLFSYAYDGLFPTLSLTYSDTVEYYRGSRNSLRIRELKLASLWPLRLRKRSQLHAYADLHLEERSYIEDRGVFDFSGSANGFRLGLGFNSAREYYDSVSPADGVRFALQGFIHPEGLDNYRANRGIQADLRGYFSLFRPGVLACRLAAARSWDAGIQFYEMGGRMAENGLTSSHPFRLLRGFDTGYFSGDRGWQFNLEYRRPLFKIEKAVVPAFSLDRVYLTAFFDMGRVFFHYKGYVQPIAYSVGGEAVLRLAFGGSAATDLALGVARGFGPEKQTWIYLRTGRSF